MSIMNESVPQRWRCSEHHHARSPVPTAIRLAWAWAVAFVVAAAAQNSPAQVIHDPEDSVYATGAVFETEEELADKPRTPLYRNHLPLSVDLSHQFPKPGHQGKQSSCVGWAVGYAARSYYNSTPYGGRLLRVDEIPSVLSYQNIRINGFQFAARIVDVHLPIHAPLTPVDIGGPGGDFAAKSLEVAETATVKALAGHGAQLAFRDVQPASVLGCVTEHDAANQRPRPLRLKPFVESAFRFRVRVEVVADHNDLGARCVTALEQPGDLLCPIAFRAPWAGRGLAPSRQRLAEHEHRRRTGTFVFVVDPARAIPGGGHRRTGLPDQLYRLFVHAEHRTIAIQGPSVGLEHLFHMRRKFGVSVRRDHPVGDLALAHPVFFSVRRSVSRLTDSTIPSSTT